MKLTILFIVMQLLTLQVIQGNDLWQKQQEEKVERRQEMALYQEGELQELAHPLLTPCMRQCVKDMIPTTDRSEECQRYEREFDCSLHCVFKVPIY
ncbi:uncharacterized protein [Drosophila kikkawai]|uniref:Uncharacterized protein n=1 Tax=Drosophila kikkawai TaxID=30033 RepID=A0A6P4JF38_DROKI|nr:uncharacterized protein LOC108082373 [Drosophila kikkawai]